MGARKSMRQYLITLLLYAVVVLAVIELAYRHQVVDFYGPELSYLNNGGAENPDEVKVVLCMGDSFTATRWSYPSVLRDSLAEYSIINSAVSGTGIVQANLIAAGRFRRFKPDIFVYQIYVGNDLFDIRYPVNWNTVGLTRNLYWTVADHLRSVGFVNYRLAKLRSSISHRTNSGREEGAGVVRVGYMGKDEFAPERYNNRVKIHYQADPFLVCKQALVLEDRRDDYAYFLDELERLVGNCDGIGCETILVVIPHASQVSAEHRRNAELIGARFANIELYQTSHYPFFAGVAARFANKQGVSVLNTIDNLRALEQSGRAAYYKNDPHLNAIGQQAVAHALLERIRGIGG